MAYVDHGTLSVTNSGAVSNDLGYVARNSGSTGLATVSGPGSQWNNSESLDVGLFGSGTLSVEAGGEVSNTGGAIGSQLGSTGAATVTYDGPPQPLATYPSASS